MFSDATETPGTILKYAQEGQAVQYAAFATIGVFTYDWLLTFCDEVNLVWHSNWNMGKFLFFATRYLGFVDSAVLLLYLFNPNSDERLCKQFCETFTYLTILGIVVSEFLMVTRVHALWESSRPILLFLTCSVFISVSVTVILIFKDGDLVYGPPNSGLPPCTLIHMNTKPYYISFAFLMVMECVVMLLTFGKGIVHWGGHMRKGTLVAIFFRDGALYFSLLFVLSAANFFVFFQGQGQFYDGNYKGILAGVQRMLHSVVMSRMILNLREAVVDMQVKATLTSPDFQHFLSSDLEDTRA